ncbi:uncharacterized protein LOC132718729 [Ruditapes philippinarum]|uniref:uncharacterized protein LOC132718729 n=1 Tax=Ruditapes philippinarum TaxID=129788 RepID=UPI00295BAD76|nr:uncharacterized protein LOC132718729 [Ruditapes philippinarum]
MADQKGHLDRLGISSAIVSHDHKIDLKDILGASIIFTTPESLQTPAFRKVLLNKDFKQRVCAFACDEAHCVSQWGENFRPEYLEVSSIRSIIDVSFLALTATATQQVLDDIRGKLLLKDDAITVAMVPNRPNIFMAIEKGSADMEEEIKWFKDYLESTPNWKKTVIFCRSYNAVYAVWSYLVDTLSITPEDNNRTAEMFHSACDDLTKDRILTEFKKDDSKIRIIVSTVAFGMGISIPDVDIVIHWGAPKNALSYWQEVGRAGRNGQLSLAVVKAYPRSLMKNITEESMRKIVGSDVCSRKQILKNLLTDGMDENDIPQAQLCAENNCDICDCQKCMCCRICWTECVCNGKMDYTNRFLYCS